MYVVAGASGNTGRVVAEELLARDQKVRVVGRQAQKLSPLVSNGAEAFEVDLQDTPTLTRALTGAKAAYMLIPPDPASPDFLAYQKRIADSIARAVADSGIPYLVFLSSVGAEHPEGTGPIKGLHYAEVTLSRIEPLDLLCVRAAYFMENFFMAMPAVQQYGFLGTDLAPDIRIPMISTGDIGRYVAQRLEKLDFTGKGFRELLGHADLSMNEAAKIIGAAIGKPDLTYRQLDESILRPAFAEAGISSSVTDLYLEMGQALNSGLIKATQPRTSENTTPTSFEEFVRQQLVTAAAPVR